ncbi:kynurenine formamidase-like [Antedon mediterranea]|uniref:kynurenine formamidase-like n=1 Tax=Antedon mediterranea TaxID=105859 RepID=UPI003AF4EDE7
MTSNYLEKAYTPSAWSQRLPPNEVTDVHFKVMTTGSKKVQEKYSTESVLYGPYDSQKLEIVYQPEHNDDAPVIVFIHGGYWVEGCPENHMGIADQFVKHGAIYIAMGYDLAPKVSMPEIVNQCKAAFAFILNKFPKSRGIYITGHSAGGHLAARILEVDWVQQLQLTRNPIRGAVLMSGLYDLQPLLQMSVNNDVHMTEDIAKQESPMTHVDDVGKYCSSVEVVHVVVGEMESPEFKQQSSDYARSCKAVGVNTEYRVVPHVDHFNLIENLMKNDYILTQITQKMMGLNI